MEQGSSSADLAHVLERLGCLETQVAAQQVTLAEQARTIAEQERIIVEQRATIAAQHEALETAREQLALLRKALFAPKRERHVPAANQTLLFETLGSEPDAPKSAAVPPASGAVNKSRPPRRKFVFPEFLPVVRHEHKLPEAECPCGNCGQPRQIINTLVTKQLELERAKAYIEEHVRYTYACPHCRAGSQVQTTSKPATPLEKSPFGASVIAWIISAKYERHLPTYRHQEMLLEPLGLWLSRPLLANLLCGAANVLRPLAECGLAELLKSAAVQADETRFNFLGDAQGRSTQGQLFGYAGDADHRFLYYDFRSSRCRAGPTEILTGYRGVLLTDGYSAYESVIRESEGRLRAAACWMHARREFDESRATTSHPLVEEALARVRLLYDIEDRAKELTPEERRALRERESRPVVEKYFASLAAVRDAFRPTSKLAQAVQYSLNRQAALSRFLEDGRIELDTGLLERSLRGPALGRKNFLFFGSLQGGRTAATLYSIVQSARLYNLDVSAYLTDILRRLAAIPPADQAALRELLPDRWAATYPEKILKARQQESRDALERRRQHRALRRLQAKT